MTLVEVAVRLRALSDELEVPELRELANQIPRRPPIARAPVTSRRMTPVIAEAIREMHVICPTWSQERIGRAFGVNAGRVSEVLAGFRT